MFSVDHSTCDILYTAYDSDESIVTVPFPAQSSSLTRSDSCRTALSSLDECIPELFTNFTKRFNRLE